MTTFTTVVRFQCERVKDAFTATGSIQKAPYHVAIEAYLRTQLSIKPGQHENVFRHVPDLKTYCKPQHHFHQSYMATSTENDMMKTEVDMRNAYSKPQRVRRSSPYT